MKVSDWFREQIERYEDTLEFQTEGLLLDINEQIVAHMQARDMKRSEFAEALGVSRAWVTKMLNGNPNLTLKTLVKVGLALDLFVAISLEPRHIVRLRSLQPCGLQLYDEVPPILMEEESYESARAA